MSGGAPQTVLIPRASVPKVADKYLPIVFPFEISAAGPSAAAAAPLCTHTHMVQPRDAARWKFASGREQLNIYIRLSFCTLNAGQIIISRAA